jgi:hypothetical protein
MHEGRAETSVTPVSPQLSAGVARWLSSSQAVETATAGNKTLTRESFHRRHERAGTRPQLGLLYTADLPDRSLHADEVD